MKCLYCGAEETKVLDTRRFPEREPWITRNRRCYTCHERFKTVEIPVNELRDNFFEEPTDEDEDDSNYISIDLPADTDDPNTR